MNLFDLDIQKEMKFRLPKDENIFKCMKKMSDLFGENDIEDDKENVSLFLKIALTRSYFFLNKTPEEFKENLKLLKEKIDKVDSLFEVVSLDEFLDELEKNQGNNFLTAMKYITLRQKIADEENEKIIYAKVDENVFNDIETRFSRKPNANPKKKLLMLKSETKNKKKDGLDIYDVRHGLYSNFYEKIGNQPGFLWGTYNFKNYPNLMSSLKHLLSDKENEFDLELYSYIFVNFLPKNKLFKNPNAKNQDYRLKVYFPDFYNILKDRFILTGIRAKALKQEDKYNKNMNKLYSKVFNEKMSNNKLGKQLSKESEFNNYFGQFEIDCTDRILKQQNYKFNEEKFHILEKAFPEVFDLLPKIDTSNLDFRIRKLGQYNAIGLFFPKMNCLCVDVGDTTSFIHEFGHFIDYNLFENPISMLDDFLKFVYIYSKELLGKFNGDSKKFEYYTTPTEVFARCFEVYFFNKFGDNEALSLFNLDKQRLQGPEYQPILNHYDEIETFIDLIVF